jgi:hypothetical protein
LLKHVREAKECNCHPANHMKGETTHIIILEYLEGGVGLHCPCCGYRMVRCILDADGVSARISQQAIETDTR